MTKPAGRPKNIAPRLTAESIIARAAALLEAQGLESFSIRSLAAQLGVTPMSVLHHVKSLKALERMMAEQTYNAIELEVNNPDPAERIITLLERYYKTSSSHPHLVRMIFSRAEAPVSRLASLNEKLRADLATLGLSPVQVGRCHNLLIDYTHGHLLALATGPLDCEQSDGTNLRGYLANLRTILDAFM